MNELLTGCLAVDVGLEYRIQLIRVLQCHANLFDMLRHLVDYAGLAQWCRGGRTVRAHSQQDDGKEADRKQLYVGHPASRAWSLRLDKYVLNFPHK